MDFEMDEERDSKKLIKKIVIGFGLEFMPPALIRSFNLLRGKLARKRLRIEVALAAITRLPENMDLLFVPEELLEKAQQLSNPDILIIAINSKKTYQSAFDDLLRNLEKGDEIYAQKLGEFETLERIGQNGGVVMRFRGSERIG